MHSDILIIMFLSVNVYIYQPLNMSRMWDKVNF